MKQELLKYIKHGDTYSLSGPANKKTRQHVMQIITGIKLPIARCGVNALRSGLFELSGIEGGCLADRTRRLDSWLNS